MESVPNGKGTKARAIVSPVWKSSPNWMKSPSLKMDSWQQDIFKVENILKGSMDSIPSPSSSVKIQIMSGKVCWRCKGKTLL